MYPGWQKFLIAKNESTMNIPRYPNVTKDLTRLAEHDKLAFEALPEPYKADSVLEFYIGEDDGLYAWHVWEEMEFSFLDGRWQETGICS